MSEKVQTILTNFLERIEPANQGNNSAAYQSLLQNTQTQIDKIKRKISNLDSDLLEMEYGELRAKERHFQVVKDSLEGKSREELEETTWNLSRLLEETIADYKRLEERVEIAGQLGQLASKIARLRKILKTLQALRESETSVEDTQAAYQTLLQRHLLLQSKLSEQQQLIQPKIEQRNKILGSLMNYLRIDNLQDQLTVDNSKSYLPRFEILVGRFRNTIESLNTHLESLEKQEKEIREKLGSYEEEDAKFAELGTTDYQQWRSRMAQLGQSVHDGIDADQILSALMIDLTYAKQKHRAKGNQNE